MKYYLQQSRNGYLIFRIDASGVYYSARNGYGVNYYIEDPTLIAEPPFWCCFSDIHDENGFLNFYEGKRNRPILGPVDSLNDMYLNHPELFI